MKHHWHSLTINKCGYQPLMDGFSLAGDPQLSDPGKQHPFVDIPDLVPPDLCTTRQLLSFSHSRSTADTTVVTKVFLSPRQRFVGRFNTGTPDQQRTWTWPSENDLHMPNQLGIWGIPVFPTWVCWWVVVINHGKELGCLFIHLLPRWTMMNSANLFQLFGQVPTSQMRSAPCEDEGKQWTVENYDSMSKDRPKATGEYNSSSCSSWDYSPYYTCACRYVSFCLCTIGIMVDIIKITHHQHHHHSKHHFEHHCHHYLYLVAIIMGAAASPVAPIGRSQSGCWSRHLRRMPKPGVRREGCLRVTNWFFSCTHLVNQ